MADEPMMQHPIVRKLEQEAIGLYRTKYPHAPPWQELTGETRSMWVTYAENARGVPELPKASDGGPK